ncbi:MAG: hypothetical protein QW197_03785 [Candidatus Aenigmatarchaeota archaeon]
MGKYNTIFKKLYYIFLLFSSLILIVKNVESLCYQDYTILYKDPACSVFSLGTFAITSYNPYYPYPQYGYSCLEGIEVSSFYINKCDSSGCQCQGPVAGYLTYYEINKDGSKCVVRWAQSLFDCDGEFKGKYDSSENKCVECDSYGRQTKALKCGQQTDNSIKCEKACGVHDFCDEVDSIKIQCEKFCANDFVIDYKNNRVLPPCTYLECSEENACAKIEVKGKTYYCVFSLVWITPTSSIITWAWSDKLPAEVCFNGIDDDCDGLIDCKDPDCKNYSDEGWKVCSSAYCSKPYCFNGIDDDCDGLIDCKDPDCKGAFVPYSNPPIVCCSSDTDCKNYEYLSAPYITYCNENNMCQYKSECYSHKDCIDGYCCLYEIDGESKVCINKGAIINKGNKSYLCDPPNFKEIKNNSITNLILINPFIKNLK